MVLSRTLRSRGYVVDTAATLAEARQHLTGHAFAAVLLDRRLPDGDGLALCRWLRSRGDHVPLLVLSGLTTDEDIVEGLNSGADEYVAKPAAAMTIVARLGALVRRARAASRLTVGELLVDATARVVYVQPPEDSGRQPTAVELSEREAIFLVVLAKRADESVGRDDLLCACYGDDAQVNDNALDAIATRVRRKLGRHGELLETVRGRGFALRTSRKPRPVPIESISGVEPPHELRLAEW